MTSTDLERLPVHPVADLFPMLPDEELAELAEDIKHRGLLQPIVLDPGGRILDGRNRYAACRLAGVEPVYETYSGDDPDGYALTVNVNRRQLRPGQRYLVMEQARRMAGPAKDSLFSKTDANRLSFAAVVLDFAPDLVSSIMDGVMSLDTAAETARARKKAVAEQKAKRARLAKEAPDLARRVDDEDFDVDEALAALDRRKEKARIGREARAAEERARRTEAERKAAEEKQGALIHATNVSDTLRSIVGRIIVVHESPELREEAVRIYRDDLGNAMPIPGGMTAQALRTAGDYLHGIAEEWENSR